MKKTKLLALASLLLVAGLVGCGGGETGSTPAVSEDTPVQSEEVPEQSEEAPEQSEEAPEQSEEAPAPSESTPSGSYESTPSLTFTNNITADTTGEATIAMGDFTMFIPNGKTVKYKGDAKEVEVHGEVKSYSSYLSNSSGDTSFDFTAEKAGRFTFVARSGGKNEADIRLGILTNLDSGSEVDSVELPGGVGGTENSPFTAYDITFAEPGNYSFSIKQSASGGGSSSHIIDMFVCYAA